jgi:hypothetical protein
VTTKTGKATAILAALAAVALMAAPAIAQTNGDKLEMTAFAVNMSNIATGSNNSVNIKVDAWSTAEERKAILDTIVEKGPEALLKALQKSSAKGRFWIPTLRGSDPHNLRLGLTLRYAWQTALPEGGRRIVLAADRYIGFQEARNQPRTIDYPFTLFEIRVNKDGEGEGKLAYATKIGFDKDQKVLELENYSSEPVRLQNLKLKVKN